jgi:hypothetical protein
MDVPCGRWLIHQGLEVPDVLGKQRPSLDRHGCQQVGVAGAYEFRARFNAIHVVAEAA